MRRIPDIPIRTKLIFIIVSVSMLTCILGLLIIGLSDIRMLRQALVDRVKVDAQLTGQNCISLLDFGTGEEATDVLSKLHNVPYITSAYLFTDSTTIFGEYHRNRNFKPLLKPEDLHSIKFHQSYLQIGIPIEDNNHTYGYIVLRASTQELNQRIQWYVIYTLTVLIFIFLVSLFLSARLQKTISEPILYLANAVKEMSTGKDYLIRVPKQGADEIGVLYDEFNAMIEKIHDREMARDQADLALRESENKYRSLFTSITDPIFIFNLEDGFFMDCNQAALKRYQYTLEEIKKMRPSHLHPATEAEAIEKQISDQQLYETSQHTHLTKDGRQLYVEIHSSQLIYKGHRACISIARDITNRINSQKEIERNLREKEILLKEIHHRVKNNLQVISSLLSLQSRHVLDDASLSMFKDSQHRVRSMALVHEQLYSTTDFAFVDMSKYIHNLSQGLFRAYKTYPQKIDFEIYVKDVKLGIDLAIPCGLILNELISNALKHAFDLSSSNDSKITVKMQKLANDLIELTIADNGKGLPDGYKIDESDSLGMKLVTLLAHDQLQGNLEIVRENGTRFIIQFKEPE